MTDARFCDLDGTLQPLNGLPGVPYLYQWVHVLEGQPLHLDAHLRLLQEAFGRLFGRAFHPGRADIVRRIGALLQANRYPAAGSSFVRMRLYATGELLLLPGGISLYTGYALRSLRPTAALIACEIPCRESPTSAREAAALLNRELATAAGAQVAIRCGTDGLRDADDAPLFAVRGLRVITPPAPPSIEGQIAREAIATAGLELTEEPLTPESVRLSDELFYFDHRGITSLASCEGTPYMNLIAMRIARALVPPF